MINKITGQIRVKGVNINPEADVFANVKTLDDLKKAHTKEDFFAHLPKFQQDEAFLELATDMGLEGLPKPKAEAAALPEAK